MSDPSLICFDGKYLVPPVAQLRESHAFKR